mgnify:CR=1 FL=1
MRSVSRHVQLALSLPSALNDHYSPVKAADYIEQRLRPAIAYYRRRVPVNTLFRITMKVLLLSAAVASSVLAKYEYKQLVTIATAFASMITAYSEFADAGRKVERCVHTCTPIGGTEDPTDALTGNSCVGRQVLSRHHCHRRLAHRMGVDVICAEGLAD